MIYQVEYKNQNWGCSDIVAASPLESATIYLQQDSEERWQDYDEIIVSSGFFGKKRDFFAIKDLLPLCNPGIRAVSDNPTENTTATDILMHPLQEQTSQVMDETPSFPPHAGQVPASRNGLRHKSKFASSAEFVC